MIPMIHRPGDDNVFFNFRLNYSYSSYSHLITLIIPINTHILLIIPNYFHYF